jgi:hypothetical protein
MVVSPGKSCVDFAGVTFTPESHQARTVPIAKSPGKQPFTNCRLRATTGTMSVITDSPATHRVQVPEAALNQRVGVSRHRERADASPARWSR